MFLGGEKVRFSHPGMPYPYQKKWDSNFLPTSLPPSYLADFPFLDVSDLPRLHALQVLRDDEYTLTTRARSYEIRLLPDGPI
jgi:hypothetical protein